MRSNALPLCSMARLTSASRTVLPSGATMTTCAEVPTDCGNVRFSVSRAVCDSVPGRLKFSANLPPATPANPAMATTAISHTKRTTPRRRYAERARPYKKDDTLDLPPHLDLDGRCPDRADRIQVCIRYDSVSRRRMTNCVRYQGNVS